MTNPDPPARHPNWPQPPAALAVAGATGGVGRRVVQRLLAAGQHVRVLVRDVAKAQSMLVSGGEDGERGFEGLSKPGCWGAEKGC